MPVPTAGTPCVILGVSGGIAAYKAVEICRQLVDSGLHVVPVLTKDARRFIGPTTLSALASEPARTALFSDRSAIPHTELGQRAQVVVLAPATAHLIARFAHGMADDLLTATLLATRAPVVVCPAMHTEMWEHPALQDNLAVLRRRGVTVVPPEPGRLAGGDQGMGRLAEPATVVAAVRGVLDSADQAPPPPGPSLRGDLWGTTVVVSAGGTREPIDPVRYLTNRSSGRQGHALAEAAARRGARVHLVTSSHLPLCEDVAPLIARRSVDTAEEMCQAMVAHSEQADVVIMAAAVADFRPAQVAQEKLHRAQGVPQIVLEPTPDVLAALVARRREGQVLVGFAAETHDVASRGRDKLARKGVDVLVVNDVSAPGAGFDHETNAVTILEADGGVREVALSAKSAVADAVLDTVVRRRQAGRTAKRESQRS